MPVTQIPSRDPLSGASHPPSADRRSSAICSKRSTGKPLTAASIPTMFRIFSSSCRTISRGRASAKRLWLSVILHLFVIILLWNSEKLMRLLPHQTVDLAIRTDQSKDATFLELPPDAQKLTRRPDAKVISDKDRIATSKAPQINHEELKKILESARAGRPGETPQQQQPTQGQQAPQENPQQSSGFAQPQPNDQTAQLRLPPQNRPQPNFNTSMTAGSAIDQALRAAAENRGHYGGAGQAGDFGSPGRSGAKALDQAEILTDTMGVDFGPYLTRVVQIVKQNWYNLMPPSVYPPIFKAGQAGH